jgi:hypothetical protein
MWSNAIEGDDTISEFCQNQLNTTIASYFLMLSKSNATFRTTVLRPASQSHSKQVATQVLTVNLKLLARGIKAVPTPAPARLVPCPVAPTRSHPLAMP